MAGGESESGVTGEAARRALHALVGQRQAWPLLMSEEPWESPERRNGSLPLLSRKQIVLGGGEVQEFV